MIKVDHSQPSIANCISECEAGIAGDPNLRSNLTNSTGELTAGHHEYCQLGTDGLLHTLTALSKKLPENTLVTGQLSKGDLKKLYYNYFSAEGKPAREIYNSIMSSSKEFCPFCCGIGVTRTLDHYLPLARYPQYAIEPFNLVPSCRDCNMGSKKASVATSEGEQVLHSYLDNDRYFDEQWLYARYLVKPEGEENAVEYYVDPPAAWNIEYREKVQNHFDTFDLSLRFSKEAGPRAAIYVKQIDSLMSVIGCMDRSKAIVLQTVIDRNPSPNHWEKVLCEALFQHL